MKIAFLGSTSAAQTRFSAVMKHDAATRSTTEYFIKIYIASLSYVFKKITHSKRCCHAWLALNE